MFPSYRDDSFDQQIYVMYAEILTFVSWFNHKLSFASVIRACFILVLLSPNYERSSVFSQTNRITKWFEVKIFIYNFGVLDLPTLKAL